jgi:hypothetical protein
MLPEVEKYLKTLNEIEDNYERRYSDLYRTAPQPPSTYDYNGYGDDYYAAREEYYRQQREWRRENNPRLDELLTDRGEACDAARVTLLNATEDPVVRWVAKNITRGYEGYVKAVLMICPATYEEIEELANRQKWCEDFDDFARQAIEAGAITKAEQTNDVSSLLNFIEAEWGVSGRLYRSIVQAMVDKIVEDALAKQEQKPRPVKDLPAA